CPARQSVPDSIMTGAASVSPRGHGRSTDEECVSDRFDSASRDAVIREQQNGALSRRGEPAEDDLLGIGRRSRIRKTGEGETASDEAELSEGIGDEVPDVEFDSAASSSLDECLVIA